MRVLLADQHHAVDLFRGQGKRFLAKHVLAGLHGFDAHLGVQVVGQADVDYIHLIRGQQCIVAAESARNAPGAGVLVGFHLVAAGNGYQLAARQADRRDHAAVDAGGADQTPANFIHCETSE